MHSSTAQIAVVVSMSLIAIDYARRLIRDKRERNGLPLPPGPTQIPLLGSAHAINIEEPWKTYTDWHSKYGDVLYFRLLDQEVIVLGSQKDAVELLEKRSHVYSDRPFIAAITPFGGDFNFFFTPYGDHWRLCRRIFHQTFRPDAALSFRPMQLRRARQLVINITNNPDQYLLHFSTFSTAVAMSAAYDYEPNPQHDPIVAILEEYTTMSTQAATAEKSILIKLFPFLLHIPDWFPGSSLKREAKRAYGLGEKATELPYQYAKERMKNSRERPTFSMVADNLLRIQGRDESQRAEHDAALKKAAVTSILAAGETTTSSLMIFTLAMVLHPHVWRCAQAEIDLVVGTDRLPDFGDRVTLPYVDAIVRETIRWHPVSPLGIWHATTKSDIYNGYYIPKGVTVVGNAWAMSRDEDRFPNAEAFLPDRFLDKDGMLNDCDPMEFTFGFGRRVCPGRHTADASMWISMATMLATLDFYPLQDDQGKVVDFEPKWLNGLTHHPDAFPCRISPRAHVTKSFLERMLAN